MYLKVCVVLDFGAPYASSLEYKKISNIFSKIDHPEERFYDEGFEKNRLVYIFEV
jgi:hypothetical protein